MSSRQKAVFQFKSEYLRIPLLQLVAFTPQGVVDEELQQYRIYLAVKCGTNGK